MPNSLYARINPLRGARLPSITGSVEYEVTEVTFGSHVTLDCPTRAGPSRLPWDEIRLVFEAAETGTQITPTGVDRILGKAVYYSSTMCALVLAMRDPSRASTAIPGLAKSSGNKGVAPRRLS